MYSAHLDSRLDGVQLPVFVHTTAPIWRHTRRLISSCSISSRKRFCFCATVSEQNEELKWKQQMEQFVTSEAKAKIQVRCSSRTKTYCWDKKGDLIFMLECHWVVFLSLLSLHDFCPPPALKSSFFFALLLWSKAPSASLRPLIVSAHSACFRGDLLLLWVID